MSGFSFQVACLQLVANEPLFGIYAVPVDRIAGLSKFSIKNLTVGL